jgi:predicted DNA-binding WGR domain protein
VNRWRLIDSSFALDVRLRARDNIVMKHADELAGHKLQMLVLERRDASRNMARFYVLAIEPTLFGDTALVREWGRIGSTGRRRLDLHADRETAVEALDIWLARKARRGYRCRP